MTGEQKMKRLYRDLDFKSIEQYFEYCIDSFYNGQLQQCKKLFLDLPKHYKKEFLKFLKNDAVDSKIHNFYIDQL